MNFYIKFRFLLLLLIILSTATAFEQTKAVKHTEKIVKVEKQKRDTIFHFDPEYGDPAPPDYVPQIMPRFPGGTKALEEYYNENLNYPPKAKEDNIEGKVIVGFMVEKDGHLSDIQVLRTLDSLCDEEALRLVKNMPPWIPGKQGNKTIRVKMALPILFKLPGNL